MRRNPLLQIRSASLDLGNLKECGEDDFFFQLQMRHEAMKVTGEDYVLLLMGCIYAEIAC